AMKLGEVGFTFRRMRPVVVSVDERHGGADTSVESSRVNHPVHGGIDLTRHARVAAATTNAAQFGEVVTGKLASLDQATSQHDAEDGLVLRPRDDRADYWHARAADVEERNAIRTPAAHGASSRVEGD